MLAHRLLSILNFLKSRFKLLRVLSNHLRNPQKHFLLLFFLNEGELVNDFAQLGQKDLIGDRFVLFRGGALITILNECIGIVLSQVKRLVDEHAFEVPHIKLLLLRFLNVPLELLVGVALGFHSVGEELLDFR